MGREGLKNLSKLEKCRYSLAKFRESDINNNQGQRTVGLRIRNTRMLTLWGKAPEVDVDFWWTSLRFLC